MKRSEITRAIESTERSIAALTDNHIVINGQLRINGKFAGKARQRFWTASLNTAQKRLKALQQQLHELDAQERVKQLPKKQRRVKTGPDRVTLHTEGEFGKTFAGLAGWKF